jgi:hypothetical protein
MKTVTSTFPWKNPKREGDRVELEAIKKKEFDYIE